MISLSAKKASPIRIRGLQNDGPSSRSVRRTRLDQGRRQRTLHEVVRYGGSRHETQNLPRQNDGPGADQQNLGGAALAEQRRSAHGGRVSRSSGNIAPTVL